MADLSNQEIAILCDVGEDRKIKEEHRGLLDDLVANGLIAVINGDAQRYRLTAKAEKILADRGVGLHEA